MKNVYIVSVQPDPEGPIFGRNMNPQDFMKAQDFGHDHVERITKDLLVAGAATAQVAGFGATLPAGLGVNIAKGNVVDANGVLYETDVADDAPSLMTMTAAHVSLPRIDLIVATIAINTEVLSELESFRRIRTQAELEAALVPYPPTQYDVPTELHTRAVVSVKTGVPNASPVAPVAGAGEVPLWRVHVAAGQTVLAGGDLTDVRVLMKSLYQVAVDLAAANVLIATLNAGAELLAHKGQVNGYAALDGTGKVPVAQIPAYAISEVFAANSQAAMLALTAERGDFAIRSDLGNQGFILSAEPAATLANWKPLVFPALLSFNGRTGPAITLLLADVTAALGFTPVNKAGDAMTGALSVISSVYGTPLLDLNGSVNANPSLTYDVPGGSVLAAWKMAGVDQVIFDSRSVHPLARFYKQLYDDFLVELENPSGSGLDIKVGASLSQRVLRGRTDTTDLFHFLSNGLVALGHGAPDLSGTGKVHMAGDSFRLDEFRSPASGAAGKKGEVCFDANYMYVCTATNTWKRSALTGGY